MDEINFDAPPQMVYAILLDRAKSDPMLARTIEAAQWQAAALVLAKGQEGDEESVADEES